MIGLFDSGCGGLTIYDALRRVFPQRSFLYLGDHAKAPYGERPADEIRDLTQASVERLFGAGCDLVILACNTASANALRPLQQNWLMQTYPARRILGVLVPMVEAITGMPWMDDPVHRPAAPARTVAVFATSRTVSSNAYPAEIAKRAPEVRVVQQACPALVDLIENRAPREALREAVQGYVAAMMAQLAGRRLDAVMLGCTHYPLVADLFVEALPDSVEVLSQPELVARSLAHYLERHPEFDDQDGLPTRFLTTGDAPYVSAVSSLFLGREALFSQVHRDGGGDVLR
jgi:glutamate racemase